MRRGGSASILHAFADGVPTHHLAAELVKDRKGPLFRSYRIGWQDRSKDRKIPQTTALRMIRRWAWRAGLLTEICAPSFRGTGITEYLGNGGDLEVAARIVGHESTHTTQLYKRVREEILLDRVEQIHI